MPSFHYPKIERRHPIGWVLLGVFFAYLIINQLIFSLFPKRAAPTFLQDEILLEQVIMLKSMVGTFGASEEEQKNILSHLDNPISSLVDHKNRYATAAKLYIVMRHEQGKAITPQDLKILQQSSNLQDRAFAEIYAHQKLTPEQAKNLSGELKKNNFLNLMAKIHAYEEAGNKNARSEMLPYELWTIKIFVFFLIGIFFFVGLYLLWVYMRHRVKGFWKPEGHPAPALSGTDSDRYAARVALFLFLLMLVSGMRGEWLQRWIGTGGTLLVAQTLELLLLIGIFSLPIYQQKDTVLRFFGQVKHFGKLVLWGVSGAIVNIPILFVLGMISAILLWFLPEPSHPIIERVLSSGTFITQFSVFFGAVILAPIIEELVFRGLLLPALTKRFKSPAKGIVISSLLFAAIHPQGIVLWPQLAAIGAMAALLTYQTRSLVPGMVMHAVHNCTLLILTTLTL